MVTIYDIAEKTGYSAPTVSKALNGTGKLSARTRQRILEIAREMGYETNMAAKALITKKSHLIGVVFEDSKMCTGFQHPLFGPILNRFRMEIEAAGYDLVFLSRNFNMTYLKHARFRGVDGVIIINPDERDIPVITEMKREGIPCVSTNDYMEGIPTVLTDNRSEGYKVTEHLIEMGHRKIAFLAGPFSPSSTASEERYEGFIDCMKDHGIPFDRNYFEECPLWDMSSGYEGVAKLYSRVQDFTALYCANDVLAFGVMQFAEKNNISIPTDISLIGFDDDRISSFSNPKLTTVKQDGDKIADIAAEILMTSMAGLPVPSVVRVSGHLIKRESVARICE